MFRISRYLQLLASPSALEKAAAAPAAKPSGPVVIWNLIRRCNLTCKHCYSTSADTDFKGELSTDEALSVMDDLRRFGVPVLILSGGEPLMRSDIFDLAHRAKDLGFYVALSTNGTLIDETNLPSIRDVEFDYLGISIDGLEETHDLFRRRPGAFRESLHGIRLCREAGIRVGMRFTLTKDNARDLPGLLQLMEREDVGKFYLSHLNYAGRGNKNRGDDAHFQMTRQAMDLLIETCWQRLQAGIPSEFVTGNNDADGVYLLHWAKRRFPDRVAALRRVLRNWGGNASGVNVANIDNLGNVHPDTFWWNHDLGNVRDRPFPEIWEDISDPLMAGLKQSPRPLQGRCAGCAHLDICNGNTRTRAYQLTGDFWAEDPGCYLSDAEIGLPDSVRRDRPGILRDGTLRERRLGL
jgi:heme d1 biosynthesis radical SAM protein NirJ